MKIAHISDLHLCRSTSRLAQDAMAADIGMMKPDVIAVSGDITDRGRNYQYRLALDFLKSLGTDLIVVPGNREICASTFWEWMVPRLSMRRYRHFMGASDRIVYRSEAHKTLIIGLNSVHFFPSWPGTVERECRYWFQRLVSESDGYLKVIVLHHPVTPVIRGSSFWAHQLSDAAAILRICFEHGVRIVLQGHKHRSTFLELREPESGNNVIISSCGAPLIEGGDRVYHVIESKDGMIRAELREYKDSGFVRKACYEFVLATK